MRKKTIIVVFGILAILFSQPSGQEYPLNVRVEVTPELYPGMIRTEVPFTVDIYFENVSAWDIPGSAFTPYFYGTDGITIGTPVQPNSGEICFGNVTIMNEINDFSASSCMFIDSGSWDGNFPDTFSYGGCSFATGRAPALGELKCFSIGYQIDEEGTLCIDLADFWPPRMDRSFAALSVGRTVLLAGCSAL